MSSSAAAGAQNLLNRENPSTSVGGLFFCLKMAPKRHPKEKREPEKALVYYVLVGGAYGI